MSSFCFDQEASVMRPFAHVDYAVSKLMQKLNVNCSLCGNDKDDLPVFLSNSIIQLASSTIFL